MSEGGYIGTLSETFDRGPHIYFSHNDIVWSAAHENVGLGISALRKIVETLFMELTQGKELNTIAFGKPPIETFDFATRLFQQWQREEYRIDRAPETIYFVGDNPESDRRGSRRQPCCWISVHGSLHWHVYLSGRNKIISCALELGRLFAGNYNRPLKFWLASVFIRIMAAYHKYFLIPNSDSFIMGLLINV